MKISQEDILRVLDRVRVNRAEIVEGEFHLTDFEVDVVITALEIAGEV